MNEQRKDFTGVWIPAHIIEDKDLKPIEMLLWSNIACFDVCFMSNEFLAERLGVSARYIREMVGNLKSKGYVKFVNFDGRKRYIKAIYDKTDRNHSSPKTGTTAHLREEPQFLSDRNHSSSIDNNIEYILDNSLDNNYITSEEPAKTSFAEDENTKKLNKEIGEVIKAFEVINPTCKTYYKNKTQRKACEDLIELYSFEKVLKVVGILDKIKATPYMPTITTPVQLYQKWSALEMAMLRLKNKQESSVTQIV